MGDVVGAYLDLNTDPVVIKFTVSKKISRFSLIFNLYFLILISFCLQVNGVDQGVAYRVNKTQLGGQALYPHILTKNQDFSVNFGQMDKPMYPLLKGDTFFISSCLEMK